MRGRLLAAFEVFLAITWVIGHNVFHVLPLQEQFVIVAFASASLWLRHRGWRDYGLVKPSQPVWFVIGVVLATAVVLQLISAFITDPLMLRIFHKTADLTEFGPLVGHVRTLILGLFLVWVVGAFFEELAYRGFLLNRIADIGGNSRAAMAVAFVVMVGLFSIGHAYQGPSGMVDTGVTAVVLGSVYLLTGRNLWITILAHGLSDTIALVAIFLDKVPAVHG